MTDKPSLQNVMSTTRLLLNPEIKKAMDLKDGYISRLCGVVMQLNFEQML